MTPESQRIAIAKACGWKMTPISRAFDVHPKFRHVAHTLDQEFSVNELPDYLNDLNAMHEAEKVLTEEQAEKYEAYLNDPTVYPGDNAPPAADYIFHASAAQRSEAFLKTLGEWTDA